MSNTFTAVRTAEAEVNRLFAARDEFYAQHGHVDDRGAIELDYDALTAGQRQRYDSIGSALSQALNALDAAKDDQSTDLANRAEKVERVRQASMNPNNLTRATPDRDNKLPAARQLDDAHRRGLPDHAAETVERMLNHESGQRREAAAEWVDVAASSEYLNAFAKRLSDPVGGHLTWTPAEGEAWRRADTYARTALSLSGASAMLPLALDPAILLTNSGSVGGIRSLARTETVATNAWNGVTSAGATAEWKTEGSQAADGTPAVAGKQVPVFMLDIDAIVSYEVAQDALNLAGQLGQVLADAAAVKIDAALATGAGSTEPTGIITALTGSSEVLTAGAFGAANVVALQNALPARFQPNAAFVGSLPVRNTIGSFETTNGALRFPELANGNLLARRFVEDSNISSDSSTSGSKFLTYGDWNQFLIVNHVGSSMEVLPGYGANQRPTAQKHYFLTMRIGADALIPGAFRYLKKS